MDFLKTDVNIDALFKVRTQVRFYSSIFFFYAPSPQNYTFHDFL